MNLWSDENLGLPSALRVAQWLEGFAFRFCQHFPSAHDAKRHRLQLGSSSSQILVNRIFINTCKDAVRSTSQSHTRLALVHMRLW